MGSIIETKPDTCEFIAIIIRSSAAHVIYSILLIVVLSFICCTLDVEGIDVVVWWWKYVSFWKVNIRTDAADVMDGDARATSAHGNEDYCIDNGNGYSSAHVLSVAHLYIKTIFHSTYNLFW